MLNPGLTPGVRKLHSRHLFSVFATDREMIDPCLTLVTSLRRVSIHPLRCNNTLGASVAVATCYFRGGCYLLPATCYLLPHFSISPLTALHPPPIPGLLTPSFLFLPANPDLPATYIHVYPLTSTNHTPHSPQIEWPILTQIEWRCTRSSSRASCK